MTNVIANQIRSRRTSPRSAAKTPSWQVTLDSTRIVVNTPEYGMSISMPCGGHGWAVTDRTVKYIANSAAKNMSSLESQMIVPTLTRFGRVNEAWRGAWSVAAAV